MVNKEIAKEDYKSFKQVAEFNFNGIVDDPRRTAENVNTRFALCLAMDLEGWNYIVQDSISDLKRLNILHNIKKGNDLLFSDPDFRKRFNAVMNLDFIDYDKLDLIKYHTDKLIYHTNAIESLKHA